MGLETHPFASKVLGTATTQDIISLPYMEIVDTTLWGCLFGRKSRKRP